MIQIKRKSIGKCILLSIITFGIYGIFWMASVEKNVRSMEKNEKSIAPVVLLWCFVPFYSLYWFLTRGKKIRNGFKELNCSAGTSGALSLIFAIFGLGMLSMVIMQSDFNYLASDIARSTSKGPEMKIIRKNVFAHMLLSVITFRIYDVFWMYSLENNVFSLEKRKKSSLSTILLCMFVPFYHLYWWYSRAKSAKAKIAELGGKSRANGAICLILSMIGLSNISMAIMQADFNRVSAENIEYVGVYNFGRFKLNDLEYLRLDKWSLICYNIGRFFLRSVPMWFRDLGKKIWKLFLRLGEFLTYHVKDIAYTFVKGNWAVKLSFLVFGLGNLYYGQVLRGILFLLFEIVFIWFMFLPEAGGLVWLAKCQFFQAGSTVGNRGPETVMDGYWYNGEFYGQEATIFHDDSARVLFYGILTIAFICAFVYTWRLQVKQCRICMDIRASGKKIKSGKDDLKSLLDDQFHKTLLAVPVLGIFLFTVLPIIYMILIAFTNYGDYKGVFYSGTTKLFEWVGFTHFETFFGQNTNLGEAFGDILIWTLTWAFFATFTNYFLGMMVALLINKKGIKFKKVWRTILVMTIAIPQFISLLYVKNLFTRTGLFGSILIENNWIPDFMTIKNLYSLWEHPVTAKILVIIINIWVGIPYVMLMATGILMNIPADLYESSRVDGANGVQQFTKITLPYMLFVTGPYLLTSFVGNLNNFNIINFLSGGGPLYTSADGFTAAGGVPVGHTDLLVTWLYRMTMGATKVEYYSASVIGIMVFLVVAILSLIVYNVIPSTKNEEDYA